MRYVRRGGRYVAFGCGRRNLNNLAHRCSLELSSAAILEQESLGCPQLIPCNGLVFFDQKNHCTLLNILATGSNYENDLHRTNNANPLIRSLIR